MRQDRGGKRRDAGCAFVGFSTIAPSWICFGIVRIAMILAVLKSSDVLFVYLFVVLFVYLGRFAPQSYSNTVLH